MDYSVLDMETDGLLEEMTKMHCLCVTQFRNGESNSFALTTLEEVQAFLDDENTIVGHNLKRFDIPGLKKFGLRIRPEIRLIDTLALSWYIYPNRLKHGLEEHGIDVGIEKPPISDWSNLSLDQYIFRCSEDVKINVKIFHNMMDYLMLLYNNNIDDVHRLINYLMFKMDCALEQEEMRWKLDKQKCEGNLEFFKEELQRKKIAVSRIMPTKKEYKDIPRPAKMTKKDGSISAAGEKWLELLKEHGLPKHHLSTVRILKSEEPGNPGSHAQLKDWLFDLGWTPETFNYVREEDGTMRSIPQVNNKETGEVCDSIKKLFEEKPELEELNGFFILRHRIGILEGFLENVSKDSFLQAQIKGFTNTLRFQHTTIVNLPTIPKPYWEKVRECLIAPSDQYVLCGSDMSGLEDSTKRHYMFYFDPEYVKEMMTDDFDPHLDIAVLAGLLTKEQADEHKLYEKTKDDPIRQGKSHKPVRLKAKKVNFAGVYGAGPPKIALTANIPLAEAKKLHVTYWKRNWAVKKIAENCKTKVVNGQMWLHNPVSQFWYSLRAEKDKFSTLNQGTGVYCFDTWIKYNRKQGIKICGQFHDEIITPVLKGSEEELKRKLLNSIDWTNEELKLKVQLKISIDFGHSYADIH